MIPQFLLLTPAEQCEAIRKLARQGMSDHDIARMLGLHLRQVRRALGIGGGK